MTNLRLAWRLARRELRGGLSGFRVFLAGLTLGVAAIAAVGTVSHAVTTGLEADARLLLGGDLEIILAQRLPSDAEAAYLRAEAATVSQSIEMRAMARPETGGDRPAMVELKAVDAAYPLLGRLETAPDMSAGSELHTLLERRDGVWGAVADPALLAKLDLGPGDRVLLGDAMVELRAAIAREPDRVASIAAFGPRLMIDARALPSTGLVQPGSLLRHKTRVLLPDGADPKTWAAAARAAFHQAGWQIRDAADAAPGVERFVQRLAMFLSFAGLTALLIGGLGIASAVRTYLDGKVATIATLKCLGAPGALVMETYLLQIAVLAGLGTALGLIFGAIVPFVLLGAIEQVLPVRITLGLYPEALLSAAALGLLTALTFSLWPLGRAREVPAANLFRQGVTGVTGRPRAAIMVATAVAAAALAALTVLTTNDHLFGVIFVAGAVLTLLALRGASVAVTVVARRLPRARSAVVRLAMDGLRRPGAPTSTVLTSLGAGLTVLVAVSLIDTNLRAQIGDRLPETVPAFFFIDIQDHQAAQFDEVVDDVAGVGDMRRVPSLRGRIMRIAGVPVEDAIIAPEAAWAVRGDRALTFAAQPPEKMEVASGSWWSADYTGPPLISLDAALARGFGVDVGDTLTINVLGRDIVARIASTRDIEWRAVPFDFAIIFAPGTLEGAPHTHIAAVHAPADVEPALERAVAGQFVNVTAIRTREAIEAVTDLLTRIGWGVRAAAAVTIVAGALVLAGAVAADRKQREYEAMLYKVLGATRRRIAQIFIVEYGLLGLITALIAAGLGTAVAWAITVLLMKFTWVFYGDIVAATVLICTALTLVIGFAGTWRQLGQKTAAALRND